MAIRAILFDLGNTLVGYYASGEFPLVLRQCLREVHGRLAKRRIMLGTRTCLSVRCLSIGSNPIAPFGRWRPAFRNCSARMSRSTRHQWRRLAQRS